MSDSSYGEALQRAAQAAASVSPILREQGAIQLGMARMGASADLPAQLAAVEVVAAAGVYPLDGAIQQVLWRARAQGVATERWQALPADQRVWSVAAVVEHAVVLARDVAEREAAARDARERAAREAAARDEEEAARQRAELAEWSRLGRQVGRDGRDLRALYSADLSALREDLERDAQQRSARVVTMIGAGVGGAVGMTGGWVRGPRRRDGQREWEWSWPRGVALGVAGAGTGALLAPVLVRWARELGAVGHVLGALRGIAGR